MKWIMGGFYFSPNPPPSCGKEYINHHKTESPKTPNKYLIDTPLGIKDRNRNHTYFYNKKDTKEDIGTSQKIMTHIRHILTSFNKIY